MPWLKSTAPSLSSARMMSGVFTLSAWKTDEFRMYDSEFSMKLPLKRPWLDSKIAASEPPVFQYTDAYMLTILVSGAPAIAALKMFVCVTRKPASEPPHECPHTPTFAESTIPVPIAAFTAGTTHHTADIIGSLTR